MISLTKRQATVCSVLCSQGEDVRQTMTQRLTDAYANRKKQHHYILSAMQKCGNEISHKSSLHMNIPDEKCHC